jgi:hypothetical protein
VRPKGAQSCGLDRKKDKFIETYAFIKALKTDLESL